MSNLPINKNKDNLYSMWENSKSLIDSSSNPQLRVIQEIMHDHAPKHNLKKQYELHEKIRNDEDYDDWEYGTEPDYGISQKLT